MLLHRNLTLFLFSLSPSVDASHSLRSEYAKDSEKSLFILNWAHVARLITSPTQVGPRLSVPIHPARPSPPLANSPPPILEVVREARAGSFVGGLS
jgi:hypothetical protein